MTDRFAADLPRWKRLSLRQAEAGLSAEDLWLAYFSLGGRHTSDEVGRYLSGDYDFSPDQGDILAATLFDSSGVFERDDIGYDESLGEGTSPDGDVVALSPLGPVTEANAIQTAVWIDGLGKASPSPQSETHFLARSFDDGNLVRLDRAPDSSWEVHPNGDEVIHLVSGSMLVSVELGDSDHEVQLVTGQTLVIPANTWHRHVAVDPAAVLFVTPIRDTKQRLVAGSDHVHETTGLDTAS